MGEGSKFTLIWKVFLTFLKISPITFGGGYAMIPLLEKAIAEKNRWVKKGEIADILAVAQTVPGSIAVNTATFIGYRLAGISGAISATLGIIAPTFFMIILLAALFLGFQHEPLVHAAFLGIRPTIVALILLAAFKIGKTAVIDKTTLFLTAASLLVFLFVPVQPIFVLLCGALAGIILQAKGKSKQFVENYEHAKTGGK
ncbi:chromate transporter [Fictibacillus sp. Mic-4]|uniref:chromate transporter n=1 Tax=Fictibacillus TaxID=1329200 RepID=UPI0004250729|nr:chromate transporter [Fictibacillus gelatini]